MSQNPGRRVKVDGSNPFGLLTAAFQIIVCLVLWLAHR